MRRWMLGVSVILALMTRAGPCQAGFSLGAAGNYGVLVEANAGNFQLNNSTVFGNVGIGAGVGGVQIASNGFIMPAPGQPGTGRLDLADPAFSFNNMGNVSGGVFFNQSQVTTALNTVNSLNTTLGAEAGTALTISGGGQMILAANGTLDAGGNRVFTIAANGTNNNNQGVTVVGTASDFVVFNINNGTTNQDLGGPILLSGGITSDHVLINFVGTSGNLGSGPTNGANVNAVILAPNMKVNLDNVTINGRLFGGRAGQDFSIVSGFQLNQPAVVPEPTSLVLLAVGGLGALGICRLRVRKRAD
jgi:hypothetical protein